MLTGRLGQALREVGPIVDFSTGSSKKKNQVIVNYGGREAFGWYKVGVETNYPITMTSLLIKSIDFKVVDQSCSHNRFDVDLFR